MGRGGGVPSKKKGDFGVMKLDFGVMSHWLINKKYIIPYFGVFFYNFYPFKYGNKYSSFQEPLLSY